jgi:hypothetical protein
MTPPSDATALAKIAYQAYSKTTGGLNFQGMPMPTWDNLGPKIQRAWQNAAQAVADHLNATTTK